MKARILVAFLLGIYLPAEAQSPVVFWVGGSDTLWQNPSNWSTGFVPTINDSVVVQQGVNHIGLTTSASCKYLLIKDNGLVKVYNGSNLNVDLDVSLGEGSGGSIVFHGGNTIVQRNLQTRANSNFEMYAGTITFQEWVEDYDAALYYGKGNIRLNGGTIYGLSVYFSNTELSGIMDGPFEMQLSGNLYTSDNWQISDGHVTLTHTAWPGGAGFSVSPGGNGIGRICSVTFDFPSQMNHHTSIPFASEKLHIEGDLDIIQGTLRTHKNFWYNVILDTLLIDGNLTIENNGSFDFDSTNTVLELRGDFVNYGSFIRSQGEVLFSGTSQSIIGSTYFNRFKKDSPGTLTFESGSEQHIRDFQLLGESLDLIYLRASTPGAQWILGLENIWSVQYADVKDGYKLNLPMVNPVNSVDSGNNDNWFSTSSVGIIEEGERCVSPNPASDFIHIEIDQPPYEWDGGAFQIEIRSADGRLVQSGNIIGHNGKIDVSSFPDGVYYLNIAKDGEVMIAHSPFVVAR